jgi:hypothetical protein
MVREALCVAQSRLYLNPKDSRNEWHSARIGQIIGEIDAHRPLGPDGKHGDRHSPTCGCDLT